MVGQVIHTQLIEEELPRFDGGVLPVSSVGQQKVFSSPIKSNYTPLDCRSSIGQCGDAADDQRSCCCLMQVIDCILAPFKAVVECIAWILCCCSKEQKGVAVEFSENLKKNMDLLLASFKTTEKLEKNLKEILDPRMLPYIGTPYEKMAKAEKEGNEGEFARFDEELLKKYPAFKNEAEPLISLLSFDHIFQTFSEKIVNLIAEERSQEILSEIAHGNSSRLQDFKNLEKALIVLKENHSFRTLVIEKVFKIYLQPFNVDAHKFPLIASVYAVINEILLDPHIADEWTQVFLNEVIKNKKVDRHTIPSSVPFQVPLPLIIEENNTPKIEIQNYGPPLTPATTRHRKLTESYMTLPFPITSPKFPNTQ